MKYVIAAVLYMALGLTANAANAGDLDEAISLRDGDMRKLVFHNAPQSVSTAAFQLEDNGGDATLEDYKGKWVLLNFWATWCAPCRHEMPMLSELQKEFGGDTFEVLTIATGRNNPAAIRKFLGQIKVSNLPRHQDPKQALASQMGIFGLPITVILNPDGQEIARLRGDADWSSDSARAVIGALLAADGS